MTFSLVRKLFKKSLVKPGHAVGSGIALVVLLSSAILNAQGTVRVLSGVENNTGTINVVDDPASTTPANLLIDTGGAELIGGGNIVLSGPNAGIADSVPEIQTLTVTDQTIEGTGFIGRNTANFINGNLGIFDANVSGSRLILDANTSFINNNILRASNGGILELQDAGTTDFDNVNGVIEALAGSEVHLAFNSRVVGGVLRSVGDGVVRNVSSQNAFLDNLTFNGTFIGNNNSDTSIAGTINNTGSITLLDESDSSSTEIEIFTGGATLTGGGTVTLSGPNAGISDSVAGVQTLTIGDQTIQGEGFIGRNVLDLDLTAQSTVLANVFDSTLLIDTFSTSVSSAGALAVLNDSTLSVVGDLTSRDTGVISGNGTIEVSDALVIEGLLTPGESVGSLTLDAESLVFADTSSLLFEIEGVADGEFDFLTLNIDQEDTGLILGGDLLIDLVDFTPDSDDVFVIAEANFLNDGPGPDLADLGAFANVIDGGTLATIGGEGIFTVNFGPTTSNQIVLSNFVATAVPEPGSLMRWVKKLERRRRRWFRGRTRVAR